MADIWIVTGVVALLLCPYLTVSKTEALVVRQFRPISIKYPSIRRREHISAIEMASGHSKRLVMFVKKRDVAFLGRDEHLR